MNIWWVKSRSTKKIKKNTTQAFLRWYENSKAITKEHSHFQLDVTYSVLFLEDMRHI